MSRRFKIVIPGIAEFPYGKGRLNGLIKTAITAGASNVSSYRDPESKKMIVTFSATKLEAAAIEAALNALTTD